MQIPVGSIVDKLGPRITYAWRLFGGLFFNALTSTGRSLGALIGIRALMGIGESPAFPTNTRVISDWLPVQERGFANGLFTTGIAVGAGLTTPLVVWVVQTFGWQMSFVINGAIGIVWVFAWLAFFKNKPSEAGISEAELQHIQAGQTVQTEAEGPRLRWYQLFKVKNVWVLLYGLFAQDYLLYLMLTWLPTYLVVEKHMTLVKAGFNAILPWIAASVGALVGGYLSDRLVKSGWNSVSARRLIMTVGMILSLAIIPAAFVDSVPVAVGLISLSLGGMMFANSSSWAIVADIAPRGSAGTLAGMQNFIGNLSGWIAPILTGYLADRLHNFVAALVIAGVIGGISAIMYLFFLESACTTTAEKKGVNRLMHRIQPQPLIEMCSLILEKQGIPSDQAKIIAASLVEADLRGVSSHGVIRMSIYLQRLGKGVIQSRPNVHVDYETASTAVVDGEYGMGQVVSQKAMDILFEKTKQSPVAAVSVRHSNHFGAGAYWAMQALEQDMIGIAVSNVEPLMVTPGGAAARVGNNPISIAVPAASEKPIVLDMATSVVPLGRIVAAKSKGQPIPEGWAVNSQGEPCTDPDEVINGGYLFPVGGPKGYGLAIIVDILSAVLSQAPSGKRSDPCTKT